MYPLKENMALLAPIEKKKECLKPLDSKQVESVICGDYIEKHFSFFVLPDGDVLDCRHPLPLTHLGVTDMIYEHADEFVADPELKHLKLEESAVFDSAPGAEQIRSTASAKDKIIRRMVTNNPALAPHKSRVGIYVSDDEVLTQDLGWVKIVIFKDRNYTEMVVKIPNRMVNGKGLRGVQKSTIVEIAEMVGLDPEQVMFDTMERDKMFEQEMTGIMERRI